MKLIFVSMLILFQIVFLTHAEARGGRGGGKSFASSSFSKHKSSRSSYGSGYGSSSSSSSYDCPCSGSDNCVGPRGGIYCITNGGNKRYR